MTNTRSFSVRNDSGLYTFYFAVNGFCHFLSIFDIKNNVRYFGIELKLHTGILKIFLHRKNQGFVLVIACKFQCREIRQSGNMVDKPLEIQFHLQCTVILFIFNPHAGKGQIKNHLVDIVDMMVKAGFDVTIYTTQAQADATRKVVEEGAGYDRIVCSGGDGNT